MVLTINRHSHITRANRNCNSTFTLRPMHDGRRKTVKRAAGGLKAVEPDMEPLASAAAARAEAAGHPIFAHPTGSAAVSVVAETRPLLTDTEATAVQVALFRSLAASRLLRPDGQQYYDASYDAAIVRATLPLAANEGEEAAAGRLARHSHMLPFMVIRTAEIDYQIKLALLPGPGAGWVSGEQAAGFGATSSGDADMGVGTRREGGLESAASGAGTPGGGTPSAAGGGDAFVCTAGAVRQVVLLGAGLDARAWRLPPPSRPPPIAAAGADGAEVGSGQGGEVGDGDGGSDDGSGSGLVFYELDSGSVERLKTAVLGEPVGCRRVALTVDLGGPPERTLEALATAGHDAQRPSVFVAEGLIGYLTTAAGDALLAALRSLAAAPGSLLLLSAPPSPAWRDTLAAQGVRLHHVTYEEAEETRRRVEAAGWQARLLTASELGRKYGVPDNRFELIVGTC